MKSMGKKRIAALIMVFAVSILAVYAVTWKGATTITTGTSQSNKSYSSKTANQNALLINTDKEVYINNPTVTKTGDSKDTDLCEYFGINSGIMCKGYGRTNINSGDITTNAKGANGLSVYDEEPLGYPEGYPDDVNDEYQDTVCYISDSDITTSGDFSSGLSLTNDAYLRGKGVIITTTGNYSPAIKLNRNKLYAGYEGWLYMEGYCDYETSGIGSPVVYYKHGYKYDDYRDSYKRYDENDGMYIIDANLHADKSEAVIMDGVGDISFNRCYIEANNTALCYGATTHDAFKIYTSSKSNRVKCAEFQIGNSSVTCRKGNMFHVSNTTVSIELYNNQFINSKEDVFMDISADVWGNPGKNGGHVDLLVKNQSLGGEIKVDSVSSLNYTMDGRVNYNGKINTHGQTGVVNITLSGGSTWVLTGDSYISSLNVTEGLINLNGHNLYVNGIRYSKYAIPVTGVSLNKTSLSLYAGDSETLKAIVRPSNATHKDVKWSSSDTSVASVSSAGKVKAKKAGYCTIQVKTEDGYYIANCSVQVKDAVRVTGVSLNKSAVTLKKGSTETLVATVKPSSATNKAVKWSSSNNDVASVTSSGTVNGKSIGTAVIKVKTEDGGFSVSCKVTVVVPVTGVSLNKTKLKLSMGASEQLVAEVKPSTATNKAVKWSSDDTSIATVSSSGVVKGVKAGTTKIRVKTKDGSFSAKCKVTVNVPVTGVILNKTSLKINKGDSFDLVADIAPKNATNKDVTWKSYDTSIATVDVNGKVTAVKDGKTKVRVKTKDGGFTAYCWIQIRTPVESVKIYNVHLTTELSEFILPEGYQTTFYAVLQPYDVSNAVVEWRIDDESIVSMSNVQTGYYITTDHKEYRVSGVDLRALKPGTTRIRAKTKDGGLTAYCRINVTVPAE